MNTDNKNINSGVSFLRTLFLGAIGTVNDKIEFTLGEYNIKVPIFVSITGDERYLQDKFLHWMTTECQEECKKADGNYDPLPRGCIFIESTSIKSESITNPNIRHEYVKNEDGDVSAYNTYVNWLPLIVQVKLEFKFDTMIEGLLIQEAILSNLYKFTTFEILWKGLQITSLLQFPEDTNLDKNFEFSGGDKTEDKFEVSMEIETYMPVFNKENERFSGNNINKFQVTANNDISSLEIEKPLTDLL